MNTLSSTKPATAPSQSLRPTRPLRRRLLFTAIIIASYFLLLEVIARVLLLTWRGPVTYQSDPEFGYRLRSNLDVHRVRFGCDWRFTSDESGLRIVPQNPSAAQTPTVVILGDSFMFGDGVNDDETCAAALARRGFHIVNLSTTGYGPHQELLALRRYLAAGNRPDWVVTVSYTNDIQDVVSSYQSMHYQPTASLQDGKLVLSEFDSPVTDLIGDYSYLLMIIRAALFHSVVRTDGNGPEIAAACLAAIELEASTAGARTLFFACDAIHPDHIQPLVRAAHSRGLPLVDLSRLLAERIKTGQDLICPDGFHWNEAGSELVSESIVNEIEAASIRTSAAE